MIRYTAMWLFVSGLVWYAWQRDWVKSLCALVASNYWHVLGSLSGTVWNPLQSLLFAAALALLALLIRMRHSPAR